MKEYYYSKFAEATRKDGTKSIVTVVGYFTETTENKTVHDYVEYEIKPNKVIPSILTYYEPQLKRELTIGVSICHAKDKFDENTGIDIAKQRIANGITSGTVSTEDATMLTKDMIDVIIDNKLKWFCEHIDRYVGGNQAVSMHY